jgi:hypothetical protein
MTISRIKLASGILVAAGATALILLQFQTLQKLHADNESLRQQIALLKSENENLSDKLSAKNDSQSASNSQLSELLKLRAQLAQLRAATNHPLATARSNSANDVPAKKEAQIHLKVQLVSAPEKGFLQTYAVRWMPVADGVNLLSKKQFQEFNALIEQDEKLRTVSERQMVALSGRATRTFVGTTVPFNGTNVDLGTTLDVTPYYSPKGLTFTFKAGVQFNHLTGDPSQPTLETVQTTNQVSLVSNYTLALTTRIPSAGISADADMPKMPGILLVLITPMLIDESGNLITPADKFRLDKDSANLTNH